MLHQVDGQRCRHVRGRGWPVIRLQRMSRLARELGRVHRPVHHVRWRKRLSRGCDLKRQLRLGLLVLRGRLQLSRGAFKRKLSSGPFDRCLLLSQAARCLLSHELHGRGRSQ